MSLLIRTQKLRQIAGLSRGICLTSVKNHNNDDYKPGPYPKTKEEWDAAAKKYNLLPEEYEPYPDNGAGYGDYPKLPKQIIAPKNPYHFWDHPEPNDERNFGEPIHAENYGYDITPPYSYTKTISIFLAVIALGFFLYHTVGEIKYIIPVMEKQYPGQGDHYTFPKSKKE